MNLSRDLRSFLIGNLNDTFGDMLENSIFKLENRSSFNGASQVDFYKENDKYVVELYSMLKPEDIKISIEDEYLIIEGQKVKEEKEENSDKFYFYKSISSSSFFNKIYVGKNINKESIDAKMEDNKLKITFVKSEDDQKRIEIKIK